MRVRKILQSGAESPSIWFRTLDRRSSASAPEGGREVATGEQSGASCERCECTRPSPTSLMLTRSDWERPAAIR